MSKLIRIEVWLGDAKKADHPDMEAFEAWLHHHRIEQYREDYTLQYVYDGNMDNRSNYATSKYAEEVQAEADFDVKQVEDVLRNVLGEITALRYIRNEEDEEAVATEFEATLDKIGEAAAAALGLTYSPIE